MTFQYEDLADGVRIYLGDCLEVLPTLEAGSVDAVVTDPPYMGLTGNTRYLSIGGVGDVTNETQTVGDNWQASLDWMPMAWHISNLGMIVFSSWHCLDMVIQQLREYLIGIGVWYKRNSCPSTNNSPHFQTEFLCYFKKRPGLIWRNLDTFYDIAKLSGGCFASERYLAPNTKASLHPTQKPVELMMRLLRIGGISICDPFMGLGTTGVACVQSGRSFVGIEIDEGYYKVAKNRIFDALAQMRLPLGEGIKYRGAKVEFKQEELNVS